MGMSGKKWLASSTGKWHDCPASQSKFSNTKYIKRIPLTDKDYEFCHLCGCWLLILESHEKYPNIHYTSAEEHIKIFHPNGEILDNIDSMLPNLREINGMMETLEEARNRIRILWNQPKRITPYKLIGKFSS